MTGTHYNAPSVKPRTISILVLTGLLVGFLVRTVVPIARHAGAADPAGEGVPDDAVRPAAPRPRFGAPADQPVYATLGRDEFARWYEAQAPALGLPEVDTEALRSFAADVIDPLGRIPRPAILRVLLAEYVPYHGKAATKQVFFDNLYRQVAYSDLLLLAYSSRWELKDVPPPPDDERPAGGNPYAAPVLAAIFEFERSFASWYLAYRFELELPARQAGFLEAFHWEVLQWLGRVPQPELLRDLVEAYTPLSEKWKQRTLADRDRAVVAFFAELRRILSKADYARLATSDMWQAECDRLKIPLG